MVWELLRFKQWKICLCSIWTQLIGAHSATHWQWIDEDWMMARVCCVWVLKCLCVKIALHPSLFLPSGTSQGHFLTAQYHYHTLDWSLAVTLCSLPFVIFKSTNSIFLKIVHFLFNLYFSWKRKRGWKQKKKAKILYQYFVTLCVLFVYLTKKNNIIIHS